VRNVSDLGRHPHVWKNIPGRWIFNARVFRVGGRWRPRRSCLYHLLCHIRRYLKLTVECIGSKRFFGNAPFKCMASHQEDPDGIVLCVDPVGRAGTYARCISHFNDGREHWRQRRVCARHSLGSQHRGTRRSTARYGGEHGQALCRRVQGARFQHEQHAILLLSRGGRLQTHWCSRGYCRTTATCTRANR
jgi:hypothetical protein